MRWKIITVHSIIVALLGLFLYVLLRVQLTDVLANNTRIQSQAARVAAAADAQLQLDAVRLERWLDRQAEAPALREPFLASIQNARHEAATEQSNRVQALAAQAPQLATTPPAIIALVDVQGICLGRNGNNLMRGDNLGAAHPRMKETIDRGGTGSGIWYRPQLSQQWLVSYAAVKDSTGRVLGGILYGTPLNDERLTRTTDMTSGGAIAVVVARDNAFEPVAKSRAVPPKVAEALGRPPLSANVAAALKHDSPIPIADAPDGHVLVARALQGYADGDSALIVAVAASSDMELAALGWPIAGVVLLGLVLVGVAGVFLGNYISRPIEQLEDGLLQILNGRTDLRFEIEHAVFGGLVFRINTLLNQLMGVQEDDTDAEGRPSVAPSARAFGGALEVDEKSLLARPSSPDAAVASALAAEPAKAYYRRIFKEYIAAKRAIGDPVDHITESSFVERIQQREAESSEKAGRPVRYQVQLRNKEVVLIAVQLP